MNQHMKSPLGLMTIDANSDISRIDKLSGSVMYASGYVSKNDKPEMTALQNAISRKLAMFAVNSDVYSPPTYRQMINTVANAITQMFQVGAVQASWFIHDLPIVISSRDSTNVNALKRKDINIHTILCNTDELNALPRGSTAVNKSPSCQLGRRDAYYRLYKRLKKLYRVCRINFFSFLQAFRTIRNTSKKGKIEPPDLTVDVKGVIDNAVTFVIDKVKWTD